MIEAVLHWDRWTTMETVAHRFGRLVIPMPYFETAEVGDEAEATSANATWVFQLRETDENGVLHYYADEPPWAPQIRAAMSYARQRTTPP